MTTEAIAWVTELDDDDLDEALCANPDRDLNDRWPTGRFDTSLISPSTSPDHAV